MFQPKRNTCYFIFVLKASKIKVVCGMQLLQIFYISFYTFIGIIVIFITVVEKLTTRLITLNIDLSPAILRQKYYVISERWHVCISNFLLSMFQVFMEIEHKCKCVRPKPINSVVMFMHHSQHTDHTAYFPTTDNLTFFKHLC